MCSNRLIEPSGPAFGGLSHARLSRIGRPRTVRDTGASGTRSGQDVVVRASDVATRVAGVRRVQRLGGDGRVLARELVGRRGLAVLGEALRLLLELAEGAAAALAE